MKGPSPSEIKLHTHWFSVTYLKKGGGTGKVDYGKIIKIQNNWVYKFDNK